MIKASKLTLIAGIFLCFGCQKLDIKQSKNQEESDLVEDLTNKAIASAMRNMYKKHGLKPVGTGGSARDKIKFLSTLYTYNEKVDISHARNLYIDAAQELVDQINLLVELKPFLYEDSFIKERADISIFFQAADGRDPKAGEICILNRSKHGINYYVRDINNKLILIYTESVSEALANIEKQKKMSEKNNSAPM